MKLTLALLALLVLFTTGCEAPMWANFEIIIKDADGDIVGLPHYCIAYERRVTTFYCQQPEAIVKVELEEKQTLQVWRINQVLP